MRAWEEREIERQKAFAEGEEAGIETGKTITDIFSCIPDHDSKRSLYYFRHRDLFNLFQFHSN